MPSPALITEASIQPSMSSGAPDMGWRTTTASTPMACRVSTVSLRLSPLETLEVPTAKLSTSAESRLAASSKDMRVRVEAS